MNEEAGKGIWKGSGKEAWRFPVDDEKRAASLEKIREAAKKQQIRHYPGFWECAASQLHFQSWTYWAMQAVFLTAGILLTQYMMARGADTESVCVTLSMFFVAGGNVALSGMGRIFSYHMAELEQTLYMDLKQMVCVQLALAGFIDLVMCSVLVVCAGKNLQIPTGSFLLYLLVPFLWSDIIYLHMLTVFRGGIRGYIQTVYGLAAAAAAMLPAFIGDAYEAASLPVWGLLLAAGVIMLVWELRRLLWKMNGGDLICLN